MRAKIFRTLAGLIAFLFVWGAVICVRGGHLIHAVPLLPGAVMFAANAITSESEEKTS